MPTYEYQCQACNHRFETWQKMTDDPLTTCPECGGHIRKVYYPAGIVFKGSGFYKTDHRHGNGTHTEAPKAEGSATETKTGGESKSESTPAPSEGASASPAKSESKAAPAETKQ